MALKRQFVTIFPVSENVHLVKDIGQIPYFMYKRHGYASTLVAYQNSAEYPNLEGEVQGLKLLFLENTGKTSFMEKAVITYLRREAKNIDVLNLYHFTKETMFYGMLYKKLNPKGCLYVKMDVYNEQLQQGFQHSKKKLKNAVLKQAERRFLKKADVFSCENPKSVDLLQQLYPHIKDKVLLVPNGVNDFYLKAMLGTPLPWQKKENILLTVGRIGSKEKNHEMLLKALAQVKLNDWKVYFVGPVEPAFNDLKEEFLNAYPHLRDKLVFTGAVYNRKLLYSYYNRAKLFCLTSPFESFGIAFVEAMYFGNYILGTTGMSSFDLLSNNEKYGEKVEVDDAEGLAVKLQAHINDQSCLEAKYEAIIQHTETFYWSKITDRLNDKINNTMGW